MAMRTGQLYRRFGKRWLDTCLSGMLLVLVMPLVACIAVAIRMRLGSPVLFAQRRPGLRGSPFTLVKFRTMRQPGPGQSGVPDEQRLTPLGRFLRTTSLDELPELWNVVRGEMSLVGPRPLLMEYLRRYTPEQARRHDLRPGVTGWAQVNGRNALTWDEKFTLDVWYVDHCSIALDLEILALTVWKLITREGINQAGHATAAEFLGPASR